ncbi:connector enhancer of kinase suppressor of Ras [Parelaphostrongylus tenuis]|uniref:Connector enhancer of kinase suppressor of Ras n=1 Tax=Parelaphostrongylus tenuis TaxID=148309 RepID=A0AAD5MJC4_PARTN|nr:connector enhancer of kinase suppressor of Ras [Parelaphostrongylus tenuis]
MQHQADGYVRFYINYINNKVIQEIEDDVIADQLPSNVRCPIEFAEVSIVEPTELCRLNIMTPSCTEPELCAPCEELSLQRFHAPASDSNLSGLLLDSPRYPYWC